MLNNRTLQVGNSYNSQRHISVLKS